MSLIDDEQNWENPPMHNYFVKHKVQNAIIELLKWDSEEITPRGYTELHNEIERIFGKKLVGEKDTS